MPFPAVHGSLVGRQQELDLLLRRFDDAEQGLGGVVLLGGEPGIGKTRLAEEFAAEAQQRGARVLWGRSHEGEGAPPFWPWIEILRALIRDRDPRVLRAELGDGAVDLAQLLPELRVQYPDLPEPPRMEPAQARFRLFDAVAAFLRARAACPTVLLLEDAHWADTPSLLLLEAVARALADAPVLLVVTYREAEVDAAHPLTGMLGRLGRLRGFARIDLHGLDGAGVSHLIEQTAGVTAAPPVVDALRRETDGNPFFIGEIVRAWPGEARTDWLTGRVSAKSGVRPFPIPPTVREAIALRVGRLSSGGQRMLTLAAVMGREFSLIALEHAGEGAGDDLLEALEEAEEARIITAPADTPGRYRFSHALVRETLYGALPGTRRLRLHRQVGEALEQLWAGDPEHLAELAYHFAQAASAGAAAKALLYARRAAERSTRLLAYEDAARHYQLALRALDQAARADMAQRGELLLALAESEIHAGDLQQGTEISLRVAEVARALLADAGDEAARRTGAQLLARAALGLGRIGGTVGKLHPVLVQLLEESLRALGGEDSAVRAMALSRLAQEVMFSTQPDSAATLNAEAIAVARRVGDLHALFGCLAVQGYVLSGPDYVGERQALIAELLQLAETLHDQEMMLQAYGWQIYSLLERGDVAGVDAILAAYARIAKDLRQPFHAWELGAYRAMRTLLQGRIVEGERLALAAYRARRESHAPDAFTLLGNQLYVVRREQGRGEELVAGTRQLLERYPALIAYRASLLLLESETGHDTGAREFERLAERDFADFPRDGLWLAACSYLAEAAERFGDAPRAAQLYALLRPYADRVVVIGKASACNGSVSRFLGLLAATVAAAAPAGDGWERAARHFEDALRENGRMDAGGPLGYTRYDYARLLLAQHHLVCANAPVAACGHLQRARALLDETHVTARALGMMRLAALAEALLHEWEPAAPAPQQAASRAQPAEPPAAVCAITSLPDGLTTRELEVLRLIAAGLTNAEIGAQLVISIKTVMHHSVSIYRKIGARGRAEATAYAFRQGLAAPRS